MRAAAASQARKEAATFRLRILKYQTLVKLQIGCATDIWNYIRTSDDQIHFVRWKSIFCFPASTLHSFSNQRAQQG